MKLNFSNLSDTDFEELCRDIMNRKYGLNLRNFPKGRDCGIDLTDDTINHTNVVQVKNYSRSKVESLIFALKKEKTKIEKIKPKNYYICTSLELSESRTREIRTIFSNYMHSDDNILDAIFIENFLLDENNRDLLLKYFMSYIDVDRLINQLKYNPSEIDIKVLLNDIDNEKKYYVKTQIYKDALDLLRKQNVILVAGNPGVGKTTTCRMLLCHFTNHGYKPIYSTNILELNNIKNRIVNVYKDKIVIFIDDCFGQAYFNNNDIQYRELLSLIKYANETENIKIILNSRMTILQDFMNKNQNVNYELGSYIFDIEDLSLEDKALIFKSYVTNNLHDNKIYKDLFVNNNYLSIIKHKNYNPRIISFITQPHKYNVTKQPYVEWAMSKLNNPEEVWDNEFNYNLKKEDRILLTTIYSLSDCLVDINMAKKAFDNRISMETNIDTTLDVFTNALRRLNSGFLFTYIVNDNKYIKLINPSINDYLRNQIALNENEKKAIIDTACYILQIRRVANDEDEYNNIVLNRIIEHTIFDFKDATSTLCFIITHYLLTENIYDHCYDYAVIKHISEGKGLPANYEGILDLVLFDNAECLINKKFISFYNVEKIIFAGGNLKNYLNHLNMLDEVVDVVCKLCVCKQIKKQNIEEQIINVLYSKICEYCSRMSICNMNLDEVVYEFVSNLNYDSYNLNFYNEYYFKIISVINEYMRNKVLEIIKNLPNNLRFKLNDKLDDLAYNLDIDDYLNNAINEYLYPDIEESYEKNIDENRYDFGNAQIVKMFEEFKETI